MTQIIQFIHLHYFAFTAIGAYVFTAMVAAMPKQGTGLGVGSLVYQFLYDFFHILANKVVERYPAAAPASTVTTSTVSTVTVPSPAPPAVTA